MTKNPDSSRVSNPRAGRDRLVEDSRHDPYRARRKLPEPSVCPDCGAVYREGRWRWAEESWGIERARCPACQRIQDGYPAGYVTLRGPFVADHTDELINLAHNLESRERGEHPLNRIMSIESEGGELLITTTDTHLARAIAQAVESAYKGELSLRYSDAEQLLRATWER